MSDERRDTGNPTRRRVLAAAGAAGLLAGTPHLVGADAPYHQETTTTETAGTETTETTTGGEATTIILGGRVAYWFGLQPEGIEGQENPTLRLTPGETYRLVWINLDGVEHELIVEDADGNELASTDSADEAGATASVTFEASEEMAEYYCEYHPDSMRGQIQFGEGTTTATTGETTEATTTRSRDNPSTPEY